MFAKTQCKITCGGSYVLLHYSSQKHHPTHHQNGKTKTHVEVLTLNQLNYLAAIGNTIDALNLTPCRLNQDIN